MDIIQRRPYLSLAVAFGVGFFIGLVIFGWNLWTVDWEGGGPQHLYPADQQSYMRAVADVYSFDGNQERVRAAFIGWPEAAATYCQMATTTADPGEAARFTAVAAILNGQGCIGVPIGGVPAQEEPAADSGGSSLLLIFVLAFVLLLLVLAIFMVMSRRGASLRPFSETYVEPAPAGPATTRSAAEQDALPVARFETTYARGHDAYDDSFSIENANGDFLGECGVGISEVVGTDTPKNVTAFEVWLFDKNDIRTITKVIMSDHAFYDEAIRAKLAPKGEPMLAQPNQTIVLETASLIVNAVISEMEYGAGGLPPRSFFERFTVELSAWAKTGDYAEAEPADQVDEMLDF